MREYDDDIRRYTPILQRIIILVAVTVAVPVVLWTITAFVRAYVGPPQIPTFQHLAALQPAQNTDTAPAPTASDAARGPSDASPQAPLAITPPVAQPQDTGTVTPSVAAGTAPSPLPAHAMPTQPAQAVPAQVMPAQVMPPASSGVNASASAAATPAAPAFAWPNSPVQPAANGAPVSDAVAGAAPDQPSNDDALPPAEPITGRVPLPRRRPNIVAMLQPNAIQAGGMQPSGTPAPGARFLANVPLPRTRPADAPEVPPVAPDPPFNQRGTPE